ncbi:MAG: chemotaxis protein CheB [Candidatus Eisenbacteria bacterium]
MAVRKRGTARAVTKKPIAGKRAGRARKTREHVPPPPPDRAAFPVVGIGASAGGLKALEGFMAHMPDNSGVAFVVIQHLAPTHKSLMGSLLAKYTSMRIIPIEDGVRIEPNCIYLNPPHKNVALIDRVFTLIEPDGPHAANLPIDHFLRSLAEDQRAKAVCIILSGTGTDGTQGLTAVKGEGGTAMAQEVSQAQYDSMPRSAINTGLVDFVLPVEKMPEALLQYTTHTYFESRRTCATAEKQESAEPLRRILHLIRSGTGQDFTNYKQTTILRRIERRMAVHQIIRMHDYVTYLKHDPEEVEKLCSDMLITVTRFFRDPEAFEILEKKVLPDLLKARPSGIPLRVWVPGCGTGEEAYSIAILISEAMTRLRKHREVQIFATDVEAGSIDRARSGIYPENIGIDVTARRLKRFFVKEDSTYKVKRGIRDIVVFAVQNLIKDPPFSRIDLLSCRNVLIYLNSSLQKKLLALFCYTLTPDGYLFLGPSETIGEFTSDLVAVDAKWRIYRCRYDAAKIAEGFPSPPPSLAETGSGGAVAAIPHEGTRHQPVLRQTAEKAIIEKYAPPCVVIDEKFEILYFHGRTDRYLSPPVGEPSFNILNMAPEGMRHILTTALHDAITKRTSSVHKGFRIRQDGVSVSLNLVVTCLTDPPAMRGLVLVGFEDVAESKTERRKAKKGISGDGPTAPHIEALERELAATRDRLEATIEELVTSNEELRSANEELQSTNEELQSTNEQMETSREELQSTNEELHAANSELQGKIAELGRAHDDLTNLLASTGIATLFLDRDLCIRSYTPAVRRFFSLIDSDVGRPVSDIVHKFEYASLVEDSRNVLATFQRVERRVQTTEHNWFKVNIVPYRTLENIVDGVVLTFVDISQLVLAAEESAGALAFKAAVVDTVREPLVVLDQDLKVVYASRSFYDTFMVSPRTTEGHSIRELGSGQWAIPKLLEMLEAVLAENTVFSDFEVAHDFPDIGRKTMLLNARQLATSPVREGAMILMAIEDITD